MPSFTTHHIFSDLVLENMDKKTRQKINKTQDIYHVFAQSHDYLFYYTFDLKNAKRIKALGHHAHKNKTQDYLLNIIKYIKDNKLQDNSEVLSYLYGSITHYVLDSVCHPFIFYKTGAHNKDDKNTKKYKGGHTMIEKTLDAIMYENKYHKSYNHCNLNKFINKPTFSKKLIKTINYAYKETYNEENIGLYYPKAIKNTKLINSLVIHDLLGIKKAIYSTLQVISFNNIKIKFYSNHITKYNIDFLNKDKKTWNHPCNKEITSNQSFEDLINLSLSICLDIIDNCEKYFKNKINYNKLKQYIPNVSYSNGLLLEDYTPMKYFEF